MVQLISAYSCTKRQTTHTLHLFAQHHRLHNLLISITLSVTGRKGPM